MKLFKVVYMDGEVQLFNAESYASAIGFAYESVAHHGNNFKDVKEVFGLRNNGEPGVLSWEATALYTRPKL